MSEGRSERGLPIEGDPNDPTGGYVGWTREDEIEPLHEVVVDAMQLAWDDFVSDTGCFPDCFTLGPNRTLTADFDRGNFARLVAMWLEPKVQHIGSSKQVSDG